MVLIISLSGFVVGRFFRTGWSLIPVAFIALWAILAAPILDLLITDGAGERQFTVTSEAELATSYRMGAGDLELDLSGLTITRIELVDVELGAGDLRIYLPEDTRVVVNAESRFGEASVDGRTIAGTKNVLTAEVNARFLRPAAHRECTHDLRRRDRGKRTPIVPTHPRSRPIPNLGTEVSELVPEIPELRRSQSIPAIPDN